MSGGNRRRDYRKLTTAGIACLAILLAGLALASPTMSQGNPPLFNSAPTIALPSTCAPGASPYALGDVLNDGKQTLVMVCASSIMTVLGNGDGTFQIATPMTTAISSSLGKFSQISLADIDGDGNLDVVGTDSNCNMDVFLGNGTGTFQAVPKQVPENNACGLTSEPFLVVNLNGDSKPDIVLENNLGTNKSLEVFINTSSPGTVTFTQSSVSGVPASNETITGLAAGNFIGHATPNTQDLAVGTSTKPPGTSNTVLVLVNNGDGTFESPTILNLPQTPKSGALDAIAVADFNGDGNLDVAAEDSTDDTIFILYGNGNGHLTSCSSSLSVTSIVSCQQTGVGQTISGLPLLIAPQYLDAGNFSGPDAPPGILFSNTNNGVSVLLGTTGGFLQTVSSNYVASGIVPGTTVVADLNGDGFLDAIVPAGIKLQLSILLNNKAGILEAPQAFSAGMAPGQISLLQNFFGNGEQDTAVIQNGVNTGAVTILGAPASGPNGTLPQVFGPEPDPPGAGIITAMASGCLLTSSPCAVPFVAYATFESTGFGASAYIITGGTNPNGIITINIGLSTQPITAMATGDFNGDGKADLALAFGNSVLVFVGNGDGTFSASPQTFSFGSTGATPVALAVANFRGIPPAPEDIAVLDESTGNVWILLNGTDAGGIVSFQPAVVYQSELSDPTGMAVGDLNNDGKPDIAVASALTPSGISILLNNGSGVFARSSNAAIPVPGLSGPIVIADFNGDGDADLAVAIGPGLDSVQILTGDGSGINFTLTTPAFPAGLTPTSLAVADFNGDGKPDIAISDGANFAGSGSGNMVTLLLNESASVNSTFAQYSTIGPINFGEVDVNTVGTQTLTLTNTGSSAFMVNGFSLQGTSTSFTISSVVCNSVSVPSPFTSSITLAPGGTCTINLQFLPTLNQNGYAELLVVATTTANSNASAGPGGVGQAFLLLGDGVAPFASFSNTSTGSPIQVTFGNVNVNTPATQTVTVSNTGTGLLTLQLATIAPLGGGFSYTQVVCNSVVEPSPTPFPFTLGTGGSCTFTVQFDPTTAGPLSGTLGFADNAGVGASNLPSTSINGTFFQQVVQLSGTGVSPIGPPLPAMVTDNEIISVSDAPSFPDVFDSEMIGVTDTVMVTACEMIRVTPSSTLPAGTVGTPYSQLFTSPETGTFTWSISGDAPPGLSMNPSTGVFSGTPTSPGSFNFTVTATDSNGCTGSVVVTLNVNPATTCQTIQISPSGTLPNAMQGTPYMQLFTTSATGPLTWSVSGAPLGFSINPATGLFSSMPAVPSGAYRFTVTVTDSNGCTGSVGVTLNVIASSAGSTLTIITGANTSDQGLPLPVNVTLAGSLTPVTVAVEVQPATGSGIPTGTITVTDGFTVSGTANTCTATLVGGTGTCALVISVPGMPAAGSTPLTATFTPASNSNIFVTSTSAPLTETITQITVCGTPPPAQNVAPGQMVTFTISTCQASDLPTVPTILVSPCPPDATCIGTITPGQNLTGINTANITITAGTSNAVPQSSGALGVNSRRLMFVFGIFVAVLMALQLARQNRKRLRILYGVGFLLALVLSGISGCSNASNASGTPPNTYTVNATVSSGTFSTTVPLTLTVTK